MTPDLHPDIDDLILFCLGTPSGAPESKEDAAAIARVREHLQDPIPTGSQQFPLGARIPYSSGADGRQLLCSFSTQSTFAM
jgi:hypothetical protein